MLARMIIAALMLLSVSFAITLVAPQAEVKTGDTIDLGSIGPGQTISILIDRQVTTGGIYGQGGLYDMAVAEDLPRGWQSTDSKLYQDQLQVRITADPNAPEGNYTATIKAIDENNGEKLGNITFQVKIRITYDVMGFDVSPQSILVGPGQPARFGITITNKAATGDAFDVTATGSKRWEYKKSVFVPAQSSKTIYYEIVGNEEEVYSTPIRIVSRASSKIYDEKNVTLTVRSGLVGDMKATNNGVVVFPIFQSLAYSLAGLISNFF
jgi:hypothetical protein